LRKLTTIFELLDSDADGVIDSDNVEISRVSPLVLDTFKGVLCEMEEKSTQHSLESFLKVTYKILNKLPTTAQYTIIFEERIRKLDERL
jgi:hypothetical protein